MRTIVMPASHPVSDSFSIAAYRNVDAAEDKASCFAFLDSFADTFLEMTEASVDLLWLRAGNSVIDVGCGHGACVPLLARRVGATGRIVGIDVSHAMVAEAQRRFDDSGLASGVSPWQRASRAFQRCIVRRRSRRPGLAVRRRPREGAVGTASRHEARRTHRSHRRRPRHSSGRFAGCQDHHRCADRAERSSAQRLDRAAAARNVRQRWAAGRGGATRADPQHQLHRVESSIRRRRVGIESGRARRHRARCRPDVAGRASIARRRRTVHGNQPAVRGGRDAKPVKRAPTSVGPVITFR